MTDIEDNKVIEISDEEEFKGFSPNSENGFTTDKYRWGQQHKEITIYIPIEPHIKSRHINVKFTPDTLLIVIDNKIILDGELLNAIKCDESTWYLNNDGKKYELVVELSKVKFDCWWACIVKGETVIDTSKVTPAQGSINDLDQETRALAHKMMFEQEQKEKQKRELEKSKKN